MEGESVKGYSPATNSEDSGQTYCNKLDTDVDCTF